MTKRRGGAVKAGVVTAVLVAMVVLGFAGPASAYGPHPTVTVSVNHPTVAQCGSETVHITGPANDTFTVTITDSGGKTTVLGTETTTSGGQANAPFTIPATVATGNAVITAKDAAGDSGSVGVTVTPGSCKKSTTLSINKSSTPQGTDVVLTLNGPANDSFNTVIHSSDPMTLGTMATDATGSDTQTFHIASDFPVGDHTIMATDASGNSASVALTVTAQAAAGGSGLAFTGADIAATTGGAAAVVAIGGLLVLGARRRRQYRGDAG